MAPTTTMEDYSIQLKSILLSFINIFEKLLEVSVKKQQAIVEQKWNEVFLLTNEQEEIAEFINKKDGELQKVLKTANAMKNSGFDMLKSKIRELIGCYKEVENLNTKLLNDNLFVVKQKFEKIYNIRNDKEPYSKDLKKNKNVIENRSLVLNRFA